MNLAYIDHISNNGDGYFHKSSAISKVFLAASMITCVILFDSSIKLVLLISLIILLNIINKLPLNKIIHFSLYPAFFSLAFAMLRFSYSFEAGFVIILKAISAAMAMILLITTTPYPQVFILLRRVLPEIVVDGMFFTYRIFFILIEQIQRTLVIVKLRGGIKPFNILFTIKNLARVLGILFIHAFDMSERMYHIYSLRGYKGKMVGGDEWYKLKRMDYIPFGISLILIVMAVSF